MIGSSDQHLVDAILKVPSPKKLTEEERLLFRDKLTEQTLPIEDKVTQAMELCLDESARFGVFNTWTKKCSRYLEEMRPESYPRLDYERSAELEFSIMEPEVGRGLIYVLPKKGKRAIYERGTEPPVARLEEQKALQFELPVILEENEESDESEDFDFGEEGAS